MLPGIDAAAAAPAEDQRQLVRIVAIAVAQRGAEQDHRIVEHVGIALFHARSLRRR